jgi:hypothetical protein
MLVFLVDARTLYAVRLGGRLLIGSCLTVQCVSVCFELGRLVAMLRHRLRGLFGRSFRYATVPQPVPSWTPADRQACPRSGIIGPTPMKSVRPSCGTPRRSIIRNTPGQVDQVRGTRRAGVEPQGFARRSRESTPSFGGPGDAPRGSTAFSPCRSAGRVLSGLHCSFERLEFPVLLDR